MKRKRLFGFFFLVLVLAVVTAGSLAVRRTPRPTEEERKQMDILTGRRFRCPGALDRRIGIRRIETIEIKDAQTISEFDGQHKAIPYLRLVSHLFDRYGWPKDIPVGVEFAPLGVVVYWDPPPGAERKSVGWTPDTFHIAVVYTNDMTIEVFPDDFKAGPTSPDDPHERPR